MTIRVGLIGRGMAGTVFHAPLIRAVPELELVATAGSADAEALAVDPAIDLVVVATPNAFHFPLAERALRAGKHVIVDKPFTVTAAEGDALIDLAARRERLLTVFQNRRWDGDFLTVRGLVESGRLGEIKLYEAHWDRFRPSIKPGWREQAEEGAGLFFDLGPHLIDQALLLFGPPRALSADIGVQREEAQVDDYFALTLHYRAARVILSASMLVARTRPRFSVHGTAGSFVKHGLDPQEASLKAGADPRSDGFGAEDPAFHGRRSDGSDAEQMIPTVPGCYRSFYEAVAQAVRTGGPPPVDPADAVAGLRIIELARKSASGGCRISLPAASPPASDAPAAAPSPSA